MWIARSNSVIRQKLVWVYCKHDLSVEHIQTAKGRQLNLKVNELIVKSFCVSH